MGFSPRTFDVCTTPLCRIEGQSTGMSTKTQGPAGGFAEPVAFVVKSLAHKEIAAALQALPM
jgi:hypothetical protein